MIRLIWHGKTHSENTLLKKAYKDSVWSAKHKPSLLNMSTRTVSVQQNTNYHYRIRPIRTVYGQQNTNHHYLLRPTRTESGQQNTNNNYVIRHTRRVSGRQT